MMNEWLRKINSDHIFQNDQEFPFDFFIYSIKFCGYKYCGYKYCGLCLNWYFEFDLITNYGTNLSLAALKRMLNFNAPPLKNTAAEPVWKVK